MGACSDLWQEEIEQIVDRYVSGNLERKEAYQMLVRKGLDPHEAQDMLDEAIK